MNLPVSDSQFGKEASNHKQVVQAVKEYSMDTCFPWHPDTHRSERPEVQPEWATPLQNGDLQVIFTTQRYGGYRLSTEREGDPRYRYFMAIWNEGYWHPVAQPAADFDATRHLEGTHCIERLNEDPSSLSGLYRRPNPDLRPLYTQGYIFRGHRGRDYVLPVECMTREWRRGEWADSLDRELKGGRVHTNYKGSPGGCVYQPLHIVQWLL